MNAGLASMPARAARVSIAIANRQSAVAVDRAQLRKAVHAVLNDAGIEQADLSIALVDDRAIHELNRRYLKHDFATDVLSFVLEFDTSTGYLEGEIVASGQTAARVAAEWGWPAEHELWLYVIHGMLHLVGFDDTSPAERSKMRRRERECLARLGVELPARSNKSRR